MIKVLIITGVLTLIVLGWLFLPLSLFRVIEKFEPDVQKFRILSLNEQLRYLDGAAKKMSILELRDFIKSAYPQEPNDKHELAHKLGMLAVEKEGLAGFGSCDSLLQFGCFHGAALAAVRLKGNNPKLVRELWEGCRDKARLPGICLHGLGHAIMMIKQYDLLAAYDECEQILDGQNNEFWCQDGVSMENINRSMASADLGAYGKKDDPYYPCNTIPRKFETVCVRNHIGYIYRFWGADFERAVGFCATFGTGKTAEECTSILGSIIVTDYLNDQEGLLAKCGIAGFYQQFCVEGAAINHAMSRRFDQAEELCNTLDEPGKAVCLAKTRSLMQITE